MKDYHWYVLVRGRIYHQSIILSAYWKHVVVR